MVHAQEPMFEGRIPFTLGLLANDWASYKFSRVLKAVYRPVFTGTDLRATKHCLQPLWD